MKMAISSLASSDPAHRRGPPPNGMKLLLLFVVLLVPVLPPLPEGDSSAFCINTLLITFKFKSKVSFWYDEPKTTNSINY